MLLPYYYQSIDLTEFSKSVQWYFWASGVLLTIAPNVVSWRTTPACDKFGRCIGASLIAVSILLQYAPEPTPITSAPSAHRALSNMVLLIHAMGQIPQAVDCLLDASSQRKAMNPPHNQDPSPDRVIQWFGVATTAAVWGPMMAWHMSVGPMAICACIATFHGLLTLHCACGALVGLHGYDDKVISHGSLAIFALGVACTYR